MKKPYEVLKEEMKNQGLIQRELALRTGVSEKHISTVLSGSKSISPSFAKKLEYALGMDAIFWINLQANYDKELLKQKKLFTNWNIFYYKEWEKGQT